MKEFLICSENVVANEDIRERMKELGLIQEDLAKRLGISRSTLSKMLCNKLTIRDKALINATLDSIEDEIKKGMGAEIKKSTKFKIGDRVKCPSKTPKIGTVSDIWRSLRCEDAMVTVDMDDGTKEMYAESQLELSLLAIEYNFDSVIDGNVAVVTMNAAQGEKKWVVARGHAHIIHDGDVGMAQAVSLAAKRMFEILDTRTENKEQRIYFRGDTK